MADKTKGFCWLVGAGPGDPGLLTLRGREVLGMADAVFFDNLVNRELLAFAPAAAELICAGKRPGGEGMSQEEINARIVAETAAGRVVVRLKGGDPFVFGRGAEEAEALEQAGLPYGVVPGVSSALAGPAYAGIAVTRRGRNEILTVFTGHADPATEEGAGYYRGLAAVPGTKVMLMGVERLGGITEQLMAGGAPASLPAALVRRATGGDQEVVRAPLGEIAAEAARRGWKPPSVAVFGDAASEAAALSWTQWLPLFGRRIAVTRSRMQASKLSAALRHLGADVLEMPMIKHAPPEDLRGFAELVQDAHTYEWIIFTSANGVDAFFGIFRKLYDDAREIGGAKFAAVGAATAARIRDNHYQVDMVAENFHAGSLLETFRDKVDVENVKILIVRPAESAGVLAAGLSKMGAIVDEAFAYRTEPESDDRTGARERLAAGGADLVVFTSSSTVRQFFEQKPAGKDLPPFASIGPVTTKTLAECGAKPVVEAGRHDIDGLVEAIRAHFAPEAPKKKSAAR